MSSDLVPRDGARTGTTVDDQALDILDKLGSEKLAQIAAFRADKWARLASTASEEYQEVYKAKSRAWWLWTR